MKSGKHASEKLAAVLEEKRCQLNLTYSQISKKCRVDTSQVSRICRGQFATLSHNVLQICKALGVSFDDVGIGLPYDPLRRRLEEEVVEIWDQTPNGAERLIRVLRALGEFRESNRDVPESTS